MDSDKDTTAARPEAPKRLRLRLSRAGLCMVVFVVVLLAGVGWLSMTTLSAIVRSSQESRDVHIPDILARQRSAMNVERLGRFGETIYHSADAGVRRSYRLTARILMQDLAFEPQSATHAEAQKIFKSISAIARLRDKQDLLRARVDELERGVGNLAAVVDVVRVGRLGGLDRQELSRTLAAVNGAWQKLDMLLHAGAQDYEALSGEIRASLSEAAAHLEKVGNLDGPERLRPRLASVSENVTKAVELYGRVLEMDAEAAALWDETKVRLEKLADSIATDAGLRAAGMAQDISDQAHRVQVTSHVLNGVLFALIVLLVWVFRRHVLGPILAVTRSLDAVHAGDTGARCAQRALFQELDSIGQAVERYAGVLRELRVSNEKLHVLSLRDALTDLANRRHFDKALEQEAHRAKRGGRVLSLLMMDVDKFKEFNDTHGHMAGDTCLTMVADVLRAATRRAGEMAARYGGEEFALILPETGCAEAAELARTLRAEVEALRIPCVSGKQGQVTISIGVAATDCGAPSDAQALVEAADEALYRAKNDGRNLVRVHGT